MKALIDSHLRSPVANASFLYSPSGDPSLGPDEGRIEEDLGSVPLGGGEGVSEGTVGVSSGLDYRIQGNDSEGRREESGVATRQQKANVGHTLGRRLAVPLWLLSRWPFPCIPPRKVWTVPSRPS